MNNSKTAKLPETLKAAKDKAVEKKAKAKSAKAKPKSRAKKDGTTSQVEDNDKRKREDCDMIEEFTVQMKDVLGNDRLTLFGDDVLNAINYTMERVPLRQHRKDQVVKAFDLAALFGLDGSLDKAGLPKNTAWTRARQHIKNSLNRSHALQARISDPDLLLHTLGSKNSDLDSVAANGEAEGDWVLFLVDFKTQKHNLNNISLSRIKKLYPN